MHHVTHLAHALSLFALLISAIGFQMPLAPARTVAEPPPPTPTLEPGLDDPALAVTSAPAGGPIGPPPDCAGADLIPNPNTTVVPIVGTSVITSTIIITAAQTFIWEVIVNTHISHTANGQLEIYLISPQGTEVSLSTHNGGLNGNVFANTLWFDRAGQISAAEPVTLASFTNNINKPGLMPEEPLAALIGENPNGQWKLVVKDTVAGNDGTLNRWGLEVVALQDAPGRVVDEAVSNQATTIPDAGGPITRQLSLSSFPAPLAALTLTTVITHANPADLLVELISPSGLTLTVSNRNGVAKGDMLRGTAWFDAAGKVNPPGAVTDNALTAISGTLQTALSPQEPFGEENGTSMNGSWLLVVKDKAIGNAGGLGRVSLTGAAFTCQPDLRVSSSRKPRFARLGATAQQIARIRSLAGTANSVVMTMTVGAQFPFQSLSAPGWSSCLTPPAGSGGNVICSRPSLASNAAVTIVVTVTTPLTPMFIPFTATISSALADLSPGNNDDRSGLSAFVLSGNGNPWDVDEAATDDGNSDYPDSGAVEDGGQDAFDGWGALRLVAFDTGLNPLGDDTLIHFGMQFAPGHFWHSTLARGVDTISVTRQIWAPAGSDWLRYVDALTNTGPTTRTVVLGWGGNLGSDQWTFVAATSTGDPTLTQADTWAVTKQDPLNQPAADAPVGYAFRSPADTSYIGPGLFAGTALTDTWSPPSDDLLGYNFQFTMTPHSTVRLAYFIYRGLSEAEPGPAACDYYGGCATPASGSQVALVQNAVAALAANPPFCDLSPAERATIINWPGIGVNCVWLPMLIR